MQQGRIEKQRVLLWGLISGLALLLFIIILLFRSRTKEKLSKENILTQKEEIQLQAQKLEALNQFNPSCS